jgi:diaminohydroxyphosphoribosylaminopyrimidine deaminase/5-amino-6-(5-phosphoribosylamino)uracil reductase
LHHHSDLTFPFKNDNNLNEFMITTAEMLSRKTITIVTSPSTPSKPLPALGASCTSPTTKQAPVYRIEERCRTIYVSSDVDPTQWDSHSLNTIFTLAETPESDQDPEPIRRTKSHVDNQAALSPGASDHERKHENVSRRSVYRARLAGIQSAPLHLSTNIAPQGSNSKPSSPRTRIPFYHKHHPYYGFTNFSPHPVIYKGKKYPTSEHLFQSFKFQAHRPNLAEHIRTCSERPSVAFSEARRFQPEVRSDWKKVNIEMMDEALFHKFTQHADLQAELLGTGDAELIEDSDKDAFWGVGPDKQGRNELGKCLERLRATLMGNGR